MCSASAARAAVLALLGGRAAGATVCPSEVARILARPSGESWRGRMPEVHAAVAELVGDGRVRLSWRGQPRQPGEGAYRIGRREDGDGPDG